MMQPNIASLIIYINIHNVMIYQTVFFWHMFLEARCDAKIHPYCSIEIRLLSFEHPLPLIMWLVAWYSRLLYIPDILFLFLCEMMHLSCLIDEAAIICDTVVVHRPGSVAFKDFFFSLLVPDFIALIWLAFVVQNLPIRSRICCWRSMPGR